MGTRGPGKRPGRIAIAAILLAAAWQPVVIAGQDCIDHQTSLYLAAEPITSHDRQGVSLKCPSLPRRGLEGGSEIRTAFRVSDRASATGENSVRDGIKRDTHPPTASIRAKGSHRQGFLTLAARAPINPTIDPVPLDDVALEPATTTPINWLSIGIALLCLCIIIVMQPTWRLPPGRSPPRGPVAWASLVLVLVMFVAGGFAAALTLMLVSHGYGEDSTPLLINNAAVVGGGILGQGAVLALYLMLRRVSGEPFSKPMHRPAAAALAIVTIVLMFPVVGAAGALSGWAIEQYTGNGVPEIAHATLDLIAAGPSANPLAYWLLIASVTVGVGLMEEVMFRGLLQNGLRRLGPLRYHPWPGIILTSMIFAAVHYTAASEPAAAWPMVIALFVLSLAFGWSYEKTGRLMAPIIMHVLFNALNIMIVIFAA